MPCTIAIDRVYVAPEDRQAGAVTSHITVAGSAHDCSQFLVTVSHATGGEVSFPVSAPNGTWLRRVKFSTHCGDYVTLSATCLDPGSTCNLAPTEHQVACCATDDDVDLVLKWSPQGASAPVNVPAALNLPDSCLPVNEEYTLVVEPTSTAVSANDYAYDWEIVEGRRPGDPDDKLNVPDPFFKITLPGDGGLRIVRVTMHPKQGGECEPLDRYRPLRDCGEIKCPPPLAWNSALSRCACADGYVYDAALDTCIPPNKEDPPPKKKPDRDADGDDCSLLCKAIGIFLIAVPISAHISSVAHCLTSSEAMESWLTEKLGELLGALLSLLASGTSQGGIVFALTMWTLQKCGTCCVYPFVALGCALGVVATVVASIWLGPPDCWEEGLVLLASYAVGAAALWRICDPAAWEWVDRLYRRLRKWLV